MGTPLQNIRDFVERRLSPTSLRRYYGRAFMGVVAGLVGDVIAEGMGQAVALPWLKSGFQPPDALPLVGAERLMPRYPSDTDATYRQRLWRAWNSWERGGNELSVREQLAAFGLRNVELVPAATVARPFGWHFENTPTVLWEGVSLTFNDNDGGTASIRETSSATAFQGAGFVAPGRVLVSGSAGGLNDGTYDFVTVDTTGGHSRLRLRAGEVIVDQTASTADLDATDWSRFAVVIDQPHPYVPWFYGDGHYYGAGDEALTYGSTATAGDVRSIKAIVRKWRAAHAINPLIFVVFAGDFYGEPGLVYDPALLYDASASLIAWAHMED